MIAVALHLVLALAAATRRRGSRCWCFVDWAKVEIAAANGRRSRSGGGPGDRSVVAGNRIKERGGNIRVLTAVILLSAMAMVIATPPCGRLVGGGAGGLRVCGYAGTGGPDAGVLAVPAVLAAAKAGLAR